MMPETPLEYWAEHGQLPEKEQDCEPVLYWIWLAELLGPGNTHTGTVLDTYSTAKAVWDDRDTICFSQSIGTAAMRRWQAHPTAPVDYASIAAQCDELGIRIVTFEDADYPLALSRIADPPLVLYCTGNVRYLNAENTVGMVGARKPTSYGVSAAQDFGKALAQGGAIIISGLADGLDSVSHRAAVQAGTPTIGVLGVPIDKTYPAANANLRHQMEQNGTVISEYPPGANCDYRISFLQRNRIIAALAKVLVVIEARERSGTMSTVGHAQRYGKTVYAVPGSIYSPLSTGTNALLRDGKAYMALSAQDIMEQLNLAPFESESVAPAAAAKPPLSDKAQKVLSFIGARPIGLEELAEKTQLPIGTLLVALTSLELAGWILSQPGQRYILK